MTFLQGDSGGYLRAEVELLSSARIESKFSLGAKFLHGRIRDRGTKINSISGNPLAYERPKRHPISTPSLLFVIGGVSITWN